MINNKFLAMCSMGDTEVYGDKSIYYETFLIQSDKRILQHIR